MIMLIIFVASFALLLHAYSPDVFLLDNLDMAATSNPDVFIQDAVILPPTASLGYESEVGLFDPDNEEEPFFSSSNIFDLENSIDSSVFLPAGSSASMEDFVSGR
jgi:hypothetical protein